jgi:guanosine-3',5'-bis(diphosphate) 3'-pyrophosphohydrolase
MNGHKTDSTSAVSALLTALSFAARQHRRQQGKDGETPYINHPIAVAEALVRVGGVANVLILEAAVLHDVLEKTDATPSQLEELFGRPVRLLVEEVTQDPSLSKTERERLQIEQARGLSVGAQQIRVADKLCNLEELTATQPPGWSLERKQRYLNWAEKVVAGCRGCRPPLEHLFGVMLAERRRMLESAASSESAVLGG